MTKSFPRTPFKKLEKRGSGANNVCLSFVKAEFEAQQSNSLYTREFFLLVADEKCASHFAKAKNEAQQLNIYSIYPPYQKFLRGGRGNFFLKSPPLHSLQNTLLLLPQNAFISSRK